MRDFGNQWQGRQGCIGEVSGEKDLPEFDGRSNGNNNRRSFHGHHLSGFSPNEELVSVMDLTSARVFCHLRVEESSG
jgi:hypothetical protein